jgi:large subunit ribosomal protein L28
MPGVCQYCDRKPSTGISYVRRGLAKAKGGVGRKVTGKTKRWFRPNLQRLKIMETNGHVHRVWICTKCLRAGKVLKAPNQKFAAQVRAEKAELAKSKKPK